MPQVRELHVLYKTVLLGFALLVFGLLFRELLTLLMAILVTVLIAIPLAMAADRLERRGVPRAVGAMLALLLGLGVFAGTLALVIPAFVEQTEEFVDQVPAMWEDLRETIGEAVGEDPGQVGEDVKEFLETYTDDPEELVGPLASIGLSVAGVIGALVLMILTAYYMAIRPEPLLDGMTALFPPARREWARGVMRRLRDSWVGWMQGVGVDMLITGVLLYIGLTVIGLDFAIFFAVLSALLVLIPYFGAIAGAIPPVLFALTDSPGKALLALGIYVLIQQVESNVTIPLVMAQRVKLHPAIVAIGVVVVGQLFGFLGLFIAVPILSAIVVLVDELWVKPLEDHAALRAATDRDVEAVRAQPDEAEPPPDGGEGLILPADSPGSPETAERLPPR